MIKFNVGNAKLEELELRSELGEMNHNHKLMNYQIDPIKNRQSLSSMQKETASMSIPEAFATAMEGEEVWTIFILLNK